MQRWNNYIFTYMWCVIEKNKKELKINFIYKIKDKCVIFTEDDE